MILNHPFIKKHYTKKHDSSIGSRTGLLFNFPIVVYLLLTITWVNVDFAQKVFSKKNDKIILQGKIKCFMPISRSFTRNV